MNSRKICRAASILLSVAAICACLCGCGAKKQFSAVRSEDGGVSFRAVDGELVYSPYEGHAYSVTVGKKYARMTAPDGEKMTLCRVEGADPEHFLVSEDGSVIWSTLPMPTPGICAGDPDMKFSVCYSDGNDSVFTTSDDAALIASLAAALEEGTPEALPAHDCETYFLSFTFGGNYTGVTYKVGCVIDRDEYVSYIYDRDRKETIPIGTLMNGRLPYSLAPAATESTAESDTAAQ